MNPQTYQSWVAIFTTGTNYEADLVRDRLADAGVSAVVMSKRDSAISLNVGDIAQVAVMVPPDEVEDARTVLAEAPVSDEELDAAAMNAAPASDTVDPDAPEALADSGNESIHLTTPNAE